MYRRFIISVLLTLGSLATALAQQVSIGGHVVDEASGKPVEFASVLMKENGFWAITDAKGYFQIKNIPAGKATLTVQCLGYVRRQLVLNIVNDMPRLHIKLEQESLKIDEVTITARRKDSEGTTSYTIDRTALDNQQILNVGDIGALLPGGKTTNPSLLSDRRMALRSGGTTEDGNASFGTAVEVDGLRLDNNAAAGETAGASTLTVSTANIESVEVVEGIPSVEYGDLSNGVVKINTRKGKSPYIVEGKINQLTRQIALSKGFDLGRSTGVLNVSFEHARSFSDPASPYTAYQRNVLSLNYMNVFMADRMPLTLNASLTGNVGGYNSEADPDERLDDYAKSRDNAVRGSLSLNWLLNRKWLTNVQFRASLSYADKLSEEYTHTTSASTQPYIHSLTEGYHIARDYDELLAAGLPAPFDGVILGPTGAWNEQRFGSKNWYVQGYNDSKPLSWSLQLKGDWTHRFGPVLSRLMAGVEYKGSRNLGRGVYYADMRYAPSWREYRYDGQPTMHNTALYAEEKATIATTKLSTLELTAGLRCDITAIHGSDYGTVSSLSPRFNSRYVFWQNRRKRVVSDLSVHAGWGKSVKLPSFQVLYPSPRYYDALAFSSPSSADNTSFYAYYTHPSLPLYNPALRWQYTNQTDIGFEMTVKGTRVSLSAFHHRTRRPYMSSTVYTPFAYKYTPPSALNGLTIPSADRQYDIDRETGIVTVADRTGTLSAATLDYNERRTFLTNTRYDNGSPVDRYGLEWIVDFHQIKALRTSLRIDGNYYYYKGLDEKLVAGIPYGNLTMADGQPYQYVGYYLGGARVANGSLTRQLNLNGTLTTHIPKIRLIVSLRVESTLYRYSRNLSETANGIRAYALEDKADFTGTPYDGGSEDQNVAVYPLYYTTWDAPDHRIPFAETFLWAKDNDPALYNELTKLVVKSNYAYVMNPDRLSAYYSANFTVTKELGDHVSLSFYANNFFNSMRKVHSSQTDREMSLFGSGYIPAYYYGLSLKLKL